MRIEKLLLLNVLTMLLFFFFFLLLVFIFLHRIFLFIRFFFFSYLSIIKSKRLFYIFCDALSKCVDLFLQMLFFPLSSGTCKQLTKNCLTNESKIKHGNYSPRFMDFVKIYMDQLDKAKFTLSVLYSRKQRNLNIYMNI